MNNARSSARKSWILYAVVTLIWVVYAAMTFFAPPTPNDHIYAYGQTALSVIKITFLLPILFIWLLASRAVAKFAAYARFLRGEPEGKGFAALAWGLGWLLAYLISLLVLGRIAPLFAGSHYINLVVLLKNHLPAYLLLVAFAFLYAGSVQLVNEAGIRVPRQRFAIVWLLYLPFAAAYCTVFFMKADSVKLVVNGIPAFAVSHDVLLFSLVLPSLLTWILGILASLNLSAYAYYVRGVIYKFALRSLVAGMYASTIFTILMQILVFNSTFFLHLKSAVLVLIVYILVAVYGVGSFFIDQGARRLSQIEAAS